MAIEGPLRELGIHDVFQLLDLSRKTGTLHVRSTLRDNEGTIFFGAGRVIYAAVKSNPHPLGDLLVRAGKVSEADLRRAVSLQAGKEKGRRLGEILIETGAIAARELERQMRFQVEEVVFELMSWNEGFFSFEEGPVDDAPAEALVSISTESLLMEGARRIDEWSRIASRIGSLELVPTLAEVSDEWSPQLDLLPSEWELLSLVDAERNVRDIAHTLARSDFEVARVLYGLVTTGVVVMREGKTGGAGADEGSIGPDGAIRVPELLLDDQLASLRRRAYAGSYREVVDTLEELLQREPEDPRIKLELGYAMAGAGRFEAAHRWLAEWTEGAATGETNSARETAECVARLRSLLEAHYRA